MSKLDLLYDIAAMENIHIYFADSIPGYQADALYISKEGLRIITIIKSIKNDLIKLTEVLAEELGHYFTSTGNNIDVTNYFEKIKVDKCEKKAIQWAYTHLVTFEDLIDAFSAGARTVYELSEFIGVSEKFLLDAINFYKDKYGTEYITLDNYAITFVPHLMILKNL